MPRLIKFRSIRGERGGGDYWARKTVPVPVMATLVSEGGVATANGTVVVVVFWTFSAPLTEAAGV